MSGAVLLAIASIFFPFLALIATVWFLLEGMGQLALFFFIWWLIWEE